MKPLEQRGGRHGIVCPAAVIDRKRLTTQTELSRNSKDYVNLGSLSLPLLVIVAMAHSQLQQEPGHFQEGQR
jgi:hypothetical protein